MWKKLNKIENNFLKHYSIIDLKDEIEEVYSNYNIDNKTASKSNLERFKRYIAKNYKYLDDYGKFRAKKYLNRLKVNNNEIVEFIIYIIYSKKQNELDEYENIAVNEIVESTYKDEIKKIKKDKSNVKLINPPVYVLYTLTLLATPNASGYVWKDYKEATKLYNANKTYRWLLVNGKKGLSDLLIKQRNRILKKKSDPKKDDTYTGAFEDELVYIVNQTKLKAYEDVGIKKVRFIGVNDNKITPMCLSLNGQEFKINELNVYDRYSAMDKKNVVYRTFGLKVGENLPPITNHYHHCRSTITYI